jgi:hypothetical protein
MVPSGRMNGLSDVVVKYKSERSTGRLGALDGMWMWKKT